MSEGSVRSRVRTLLTWRSTGTVTSSAAMAGGDLVDLREERVLLLGLELPGDEPLGDSVLGQEDGHPVVDLAAGVARLACDDREGDVPAFAVLALARGGEAGGVQQLARRGGG